MYGGVLTSTMLSLLKSNDLKTYKWKHLLKDVCCSEKVNGYAQKTALTSGNPLNMENTVFVIPVRNTVTTNPVRPSNKPLNKKYIPMNQINQMNPHKNKNIMKKMLFV
jgi:hypothetical protein